MIEDRLKNLEERIEAAGNIPEESRKELLALVAALRSEIAALPSTRVEKGRDIAAGSEAPTFAVESTPGFVPPPAIKAAMEDLTSAVKEFETSHPDMAAAVNRLSIVLSNMGM